jgi:hypothetical protein
MRQITKSDLDLRVLVDHTKGHEDAVEYVQVTLSSPDARKLVLISRSVVAIHGMGAHPADT